MASLGTTAKSLLEAGGGGKRLARNVTTGAIGGGMLGGATEKFNGGNFYDGAKRGAFVGGMGGVGSFGLRAAGSQAQGANAPAQRNAGKQATDRQVSKQVETLNRVGQESTKANQLFQ